MRRAFWLGVLLAVSASLAEGQEIAVAINHFRVDTWRGENGLPANIVLRISQSADGYLWIGNTLGLTRFDGVDFTTFDHLNTEAFRGRIDFSLQPMFEDSHGVLWIATNHELVRYADGVFVRDAALDGAYADEAIIGMTQDATGSLLAFTDRGRLLRRADGRLVPARVAGLPASPGFAIVTGSDGTLWLGFKGAGVARIPSGDTVATLLTGRDGLADDNAFALVAARDGSLWVGTATGVSHVVGGRVQSLRLDGARGFAPITQMAQDSDGGVWIATLGAGVYRYANDSLTHIPEGALSNNHVECLYVDAEGSVWVGTRHGLNRFRRVRVSPLTTMNGLPIDAPGAIAIDSTGALWMSSQFGGLYRRARADNGPFLPVALPTRTSPIVTSMFAGAHGALWVGTRASGLLRHEGGAWRTFPVPVAINAVLEDSHGQVWMGTSHGLTRLGGPTYALADSEVLTLTQDRRGAIWAGTAAGLSRVDASGVTNYDAGHVLALHTDADGVVWAGTTSGLVRVTGEGHVTLRSENGIVPEFVVAINEDRGGYLWLAGFRGIQRMARAELNAVADSVARGRPAMVRNILQFLPVDGLPSPEITPHEQQPTVMAPNGRVWFSMERGLVSFDPSALRRDSVPPVVHIERVNVDGVAQPLDAPITISPAARRVEFRYTGVSLNDGPGVRFRYRLDGFDTTWVNAGEARAASFTRLSAGRYRFRVTARAADGPWSESSEGIAFRVLPPFYQTWWFVASVVIGLVALFAIGIQARTAVLEGRFAAVLAERTRLAREIHDTLLQGFTGVALSLRAATRRTGSPALDDVQTLAQRTLAEARQAVWDLRATAEGASFPEELERVARQTIGGSDLTLQVRVTGRAQRLTGEAESVLLRVGQEALANTVKHARATNAWIELVYERRAVRMTVRDDGAGFVVDPSHRSYAGHWGLLGMRERAEQIRAEIDVTSAPGQGTVVALRIPRTGRTRTPTMRKGAPS